MSDFLTRIETFLTRHRMLPTVFGVIVLRDAGFVFDLRQGRSPRLKTAQLVDDFMAAYTHERQRKKQAHAAERAIAGKAASKAAARRAVAAGRAAARRDAVADALAEAKAIPDGGAGAAAPLAATPPP